jgi:cell division protein FtsQ
MTINKQAILKWMVITLWIAIAAGIGVLLIAAIKKNESKRCSEVQINIHGVSNNFFVDKKDIINTITAYAGGSPVGRPINSFDLIKVEKQLETNIWVNKVLLFFDNNEKLEVDVTEREPIARVFSTNGNTFYIDTALKILPLSDKYSARLPVFTNFPSDKVVLSKTDSALLKDVAMMSLAIQKDSFLMAMIDQIDITAQRNFEMIPKIGKTVIVFGDGKNIQDKFLKLKLFYKEVLIKSGWDYYSIININFKNQVVAKRKGADDVRTDSLRAMQIMQLIAANAEKLSADSLQMMIPDNNNNTVDSSLIIHSLPRDETVGSGIVTTDKPAVVTKNSEAVIKQPEKTIEQKKVQPVKIKKPEPNKIIVKPKPEIKKKTATNNTNDY